MVYVIIAITTISALLFHFVLHRKIKGWIDRDFIRSLSDDCDNKLQFLMAEYATVSEQRFKRLKFEHHFTELATTYDNNKTAEQE